MCGIFTGKYINISIDFTFKHMFLLMFCPILYYFAYEFYTRIVINVVYFLAFGGIEIVVMKIYSIKLRCSKYLCMCYCFFFLCVYVCMLPNALMESLTETRPLAISL